MNERCRPMLAVRAEPFDSSHYLFEVKWNGIRALAARHRQGWDLWGACRALGRSNYIIPFLGLINATAVNSERLAACWPASLLILMRLPRLPIF